MFNINKLIKYATLVLAFTFIIFIAVPNTAKAGDDDYLYGGGGMSDYSDYSYDQPSYDDTSYIDQTTYVQPTYYEDQPSYSQPADDVTYIDQTTYVQPTYYEDSSYSGYSNYDYGCSSCSSYNYGYNYSQPRQIVYNPPVVQPVYNTLDASCYISPSSGINVGDSVTLNGNATGGNGNYTYYWSGSDGIYGSSRTAYGRFTSAGPKTVSLTVTSGNQSVTRTCSAYVNYNYNNYNYNYDYNYNNYGSQLSATCSASPSNANVGDNVIWTVYPIGGNGGYSYSWTGSDNLSYGNAYQIQQRYTTPGSKTATVTVRTTNGQTVTVSCNANVAGTVINQGTPISGVYLSDVPATGISFNFKVALYILGVLMWSAFVGFMIVAKRKSKLALANRSKIEDFKQENLRRKGLL